MISRTRRTGGAGFLILIVLDVPLVSLRSWTSLPMVVESMKVTALISNAVGPVQERRWVEIAW